MPKYFMAVAARHVLFIAIAAGVFCSPATAQIKDKEIFISTKIEAGYDLVDRRKSMRWEGEGWIGNDTHKFWWKTEGEHGRRSLEDAELQILYSRRISRFFDIQAGLRNDFEPKNTTFGVIGVQGLAPYWLEVDLALFIDRHGHVSMRIEADYDLLITQRLILNPFVELNFSANEVPNRLLGPGITDIETGVKLRYEITRELAPYVEFRYARLLGRTSELVQEDGEDKQDISVIVGIKISF